MQLERFRNNYIHQNNPSNLTNVNGLIGPSFLEKQISHVKPIGFAAKAGSSPTAGRGAKMSRLYGLDGTWNYSLVLSR